MGKVIYLKSKPKYVAPGISAKGEDEFIRGGPLDISIIEAEPGLWEATLTGNSFAFEHGKSKAEAIGNLILTYVHHTDPKYAEIIIRD